MGSLFIHIHQFLFAFDVLATDLGEKWFDIPDQIPHVSNAEETAHCLLHPFDGFIHDFLLSLRRLGNLSRCANAINPEVIKYWCQKENPPPFPLRPIPLRP